VETLWQACGGDLAFEEQHCTLLLQAFAGAKRLDEAFAAFWWMSEQHFPVQSAHSYAVLLNACAEAKDLAKGTELHARLKKIVGARNQKNEMLLKENPVLGFSPLKMYILCGHLDAAVEILLREEISPSAQSYAVIIDALIGSPQVSNWSHVMLQIRNHMQGAKGIGERIDMPLFRCLVRACYVAKNGILSREVFDMLVMDKRATLKPSAEDCAHLWLCEIWTT